MKNGEKLKVGNLKIILILVCIMLTISTMVVGVFAVYSPRKKFGISGGTVSFITNNIEGEVVGSVTGYGYISGSNTYNGSFSASNNSTTSNNGEEIGDALKPWKMGDVHFVTNRGEVVDIEITITLKNRGDRGMVVKYMPPSTPDNIDINYKQAVTNQLTVKENEWQNSLHANDIGKVIEYDEFGNRLTQETDEYIEIEKNQYYTFKMIVSILNDQSGLPEEGVNLNFSFELAGK